MSTRRPFDYERADAINQLRSGGPVIHPLLRYNLIPVSGYMLVLNGFTENERMSDPDTEVTPGRPLIMRAPPGELTPMLSGPVDGGHVFGVGLKWRYRYLNTFTGEASGLSPLPSEGWDVGSDDGANHVGETVLLGPQAGLGSAEGMDKVQVFRNTSGQERLWYLVGEADYDGSNTQVLIEDNLSDDEIQSKEQASLKPNPGRLDGFVWPVRKAYLHPSGWTWYYGILRGGRRYYGGQSIQLTANDNVPGSGLIQYGDGTTVEGWRFRPLTDNTDAAIVDKNEYHVWHNGATIVPAPETSVVVKSYELVDDRDGRIIFAARPGQPTQIDLEATLSIGRDQSDDLMNVFSWTDGEGRQRTMAVTRNRLYLLTDDVTLEPHLTYGTQVVAEEGQAGFDAGAMTPFGYVFVNERGVRVFDGVRARALGSDNPFEDFLPQDQFLGVEVDQLENVLVVYDPTNHKLHVSFVPLDGHTTENTLTFDPAVGNWRGPNRRRIFSAGALKSPSGEKVFLLGDDLGNLVVDEEQVEDVVPDISTHTLSGTITAVSDGNGMLFSDSTATFDPDGDQALVGCPVVITQTDGTVQVNWIARVISTTELQLVNPPSSTLTVGWAYAIGAIRWQLVTAYLDGGLPTQKQRFAQLRMRFELGTTDSFSTEVSVAGGAWADAGQTPTATSGEIHEAIKVHRGGRVFQVRLSGTANEGEPRITEVIADLDVRQGQGD